MTSATLRKRLGSGSMAAVAGMVRYVRIQFRMTRVCPCVQVCSRRRPTGRLVLRLCLRSLIRLRRTPLPPAEDCESVHGGGLSNGPASHHRWPWRPSYHRLLKRHRPLVRARRRRQRRLLRIGRFKRPGQWMVGRSLARRSRVGLPRRCHYRAGPCCMARMEEGVCDRPTLRCELA